MSIVKIEIFPNTFDGKEEKPYLYKITDSGERTLQLPKTKEEILKSVELDLKNVKNEN